MPFSTTALQVLLLMLYAVPGFLLVKTRLLTADHITPISKILIYICQPCLEISAFCSAERTPSLLADMGWFFLLCTGLQVVVIVLLSLLMRKTRKSDDPSGAKAVCARVSTFAGTFGNVGFFGIPLLQALLPAEYAADAVALSAVFAVSMNWLAWTVGLWMITGEPRHIRIRALLLNPATIALVIALPLFFSGIRLPSALDDAVGLCGKMATPLCMIALGMRLAATKWKRIFTDAFAWISCAGKLLLLPLLAFGVCFFLPLAPYLKATLFLLCCCPTASAVQNFSEVFLTGREGKESAANAILLSNLLCILTIPLLACLIQL